MSLCYATFLPLILPFLSFAPGCRDLRRADIKWNAMKGIENVRKTVRNRNAGRVERTVACCVLMILAATSCGLRELGEIVPQPPVPDYIEDADGSRAVTVVTGVEYPEGHDWNAWNPVGSASPSLVVFRDGEKVLCIPVSAEGLVSEDIDMHRYAGGHLYTDFCTDSETVISRDGMELFRYAGRERIVFLAESGGHVLTLGESRDGQGFSSRSDGLPVFLGMTGSVFQNAGLSPSGELRFFYMMRVNSTAGYMLQYYAVTGSENVKIEFPSEVAEVYGLAFPRSGTSRTKPVVERTKPAGIAVLCRWRVVPGISSAGIANCGDGSFTPLSRQILFSVSGGTVLSNAEPMLSVCSCYPSRGIPSYAVCSGKNIRGSWISDDIPVGFRHVADSVVGVRKSMGGRLRDILCSGSVRDTLPEGYTVMSGDAVCADGNGIMIGMTSRAGGGRAILWDNGDIDSLGFRGIVTGVYRETVKEESAADAD